MNLKDLTKELRFGKSEKEILEAISNDKEDSSESSLDISDNTDRVYFSNNQAYVWSTTPLTGATLRISGTNE